MSANISTKIAISHKEKRTEFLKKLWNRLQREHGGEDMVEEYLFNKSGDTSTRVNPALKAMLDINVSLMRLEDGKSETKKTSTIQTKREKLKPLYFEAI
jgi:hypothetical protein